MNKSIIINTGKDILRRAFLPNLILVPVIIFLHWAVVSIWFYYNHEALSFTKKIILTGLGGTLPILTYNLWGIRRFLIKAYLIIHNNIIAIWLQSFCEKIADQIINEDFLDQLEEAKSTIIMRWVDYLKEKSQNLPTLLQKIVRIVLRKIGFSDELDHLIRTVAKNDKDEIIRMINAEIAGNLIAASNRVVPVQIIYLIPINILLLILLWFF